MSKHIIIPFNKYQEQEIIRAIRSKSDIALVLLYSIRYLSIYTAGMVTIPVGEMNILINKTRRLFFSINDSLFSLSFPFVLTHVGGSYQISLDTGLVINNQMISYAITYFENSIGKKSGTIWDELEIFDIEEGESDNYWEFCKYLMMNECGYLRFDHDPKRASAHIHPLNHIDTFYSQHSSFKVGLHEKISKEDLIDLLDPSTASMFLVKV